MIPFYTTPTGNFIQYCSVRVSLYVLDLDYDSRMSPILVVEITYDLFLDRGFGIPAW